MDKNDELVMGVPTKRLFGKDFYFSGFALPSVLTDRIKGNIYRYADFRKRGECETDPAFKQIIPYCIITKGDQVFVYRRKSAGGEKRLHSKSSIGVGGHANPVNEVCPICMTIDQNMIRELKEELHFSCNIIDIKRQFIGMINWDEDDVGKVHFGLVYRFHFPEGTIIQVREKDQLIGGLYPTTGIKAVSENWETWSELVLDGYSF